MPDPFVSSNPQAWLRPYWKQLYEQTFFANLSPEHQAEQLACVIEADYPAMAAEIRGWNPATRRAMIAGLDQGLLERHADREVELWRMRKGDREVRCVAVYVATGIDLQLLETTGATSLGNSQSIRKRSNTVS